MKKILFIVCTHGNEAAGLELFLRFPYGRTEQVEWQVIVGNPEALFLNTRFVEADLNRIGQKGSLTYEGKRSQLLQKRMAEFDVVYDIHTTRGIRDNVADCIFINTLGSIPDALFATSHQIIHDATDNEQYVTSLHHNGITLEYSKTASVEADRQRILVDFQQIIHQQTTTPLRTLSRYFGLITQTEAKKFGFHWEDFQPISVGDQQKLDLVPKKYLPVFVNTPEIDPHVYAALNEVIEMPA